MGSPGSAGRVRRVLAIPGSIRRASYNRRLLEAAAVIAPPELLLRIDDSLGALPLFDEDVERETGGGQEPVARFRDAVARADGLLIATPEYNWSIPGVLKNGIDWLSRPWPHPVLAAKPIAIIGASTGRWGTRQSQSVLRHTLTATESLVMPSPTLFVADAERRFGPDGALIDGAIRESLAAVLDRLIHWIDTAAGAGIVAS